MLKNSEMVGEETISRSSAVQMGGVREIGWWIQLDDICNGYIEILGI